MQIQKPKFGREIIKGKQTSRNIALNCKRAVLESKEAAEIIAKHFRGKDLESTCFNVWEWLRSNIKYKKEGNGEQSAKTLQRIAFDKYGDCKHYTIFSCSILRALGIPAEMRLISQNYFDPEPTHIYCVVKKGNKEIIVDPCMRIFDNEAIYKYKYTLKIN